MPAAVMGIFAPLGLMNLWRIGPQMRTSQAYNATIEGVLVNGVGAGRATRLTAAVSREDEWYVARCLEVEVTSPCGFLEEAVANLSEALELYFEELPYV